MNGQDENSISPTNTVCAGYNKSELFSLTNNYNVFSFQDQSFFIGLSYHFRLFKKIKKKKSFWILNFYTILAFKLLFSIMQEILMDDQYVLYFSIS